MDVIKLLTHAFVHLLCWVAPGEWSDKLHERNSWWVFSKPLYFNYGVIPDGDSSVSYGHFVTKTIDSVLDQGKGLSWMELSRRVAEDAVASQSDNAFYFIMDVWPGLSKLAKVQDWNV